jgi:hypothetical protein
MLDRLVATFLLWGLRGCLAWFVMYEYTRVLTDKLNEVSRALNGM